MWYFTNNVFHLWIHHNNRTALHHLYCLNVFESLDIHLIDYEKGYEDQICKILQQTNLKSLCLRTKLQPDLFNHILQNNSIQALAVNELVESITWIPKNLTSLILYKTKISDWIPLTRLEHLRTFAFYDPIQLSEEMLSFLASLTTLEELSFGSVVSIPGAIPTICKFTYPNLTSLLLNEEVLKDSPFYLQKFTNLQRLRLECTTEHLSALATLTHLTNFVLSTADLINFNMLEQLTNLKKLEIWGPLEQLTGIERMINLEFIQFNDCSTLESENFGRLTSLCNLTSLGLRGLNKTAFVELDHLTRLSNLQSVSY